MHAFRKWFGLLMILAYLALTCQPVLAQADLRVGGRSLYRTGGYSGLSFYGDSLADHRPAHANQPLSTRSNWTGWFRADLFYRQKLGDRCRFGLAHFPISAR